MRFIKTIFWLVLFLTYSTLALAEVVQSEVTIDYDNVSFLWLFNDYDMPGFPSDTVSEYEAELAN